MAIIITALASRGVRSGEIRSSGESTRKEIAAAYHEQDAELRAEREEIAERDADQLSVRELLLLHARRV